ncbi:MAG: glycosyltransferase family 9 protein [Syntrophorhabdaceae bacterium]
MAIPSVRALREHFPDAHISWLAEGSVASILACQDFIDDVIYFPRGALMRHLKTGHVPTTSYILGDFLKNLRKREYDCIIDLHGIAKSVALMKIARGRRTIGFSKTFAKDMSHLFYQERVDSAEKRIHKVDRNMLVAHYMECRTPVSEHPLCVHDEARRYIGDFLKSHNIHSPIFAINPFASKDSAFKRWPLERYADLIGHIRQNGLGDVVVIWGPGEREEAHRLAAMAGENVHLACQTDIAQLYALLSASSMYIGGDTGTTHLASSAQIPVVSIFGPTDFIVNRPYSRNSVIIRKTVPCSPCKNKSCKTRECLMSISVDEVFETVQKLSLKDEAR